ncbi:uncharacterized protein TM35_000252160 [Trypanosoma theileri]|uniref:Uncharacterized protein n=1 Tax=Trypanosoma theileri TaxID=67003 RepID=A0A1X0NS26_9TRYP|nr:uncharacterized protein TM35_000252160 [Trypanosoma theileri]ORC86920.1 hypothetical protein TM35_000252160 [Trypanosoma theileri]
MGVVRYHLHIADGGDPTATVTAATLFAHLTLRCGQLRNYLLLSASTTDAKRQKDSNLPNSNSARMVQLTAAAAAAGASPSSGEGTEDQVLLAAEALLRGDEHFRSMINEDENLWSTAVAAVKDRIIPYPCFSCSFVESEMSLAKSKGRYFDFIATADVASFDYLLDYYMALRVEESKREKENSLEERHRRKVGLVHILCGEPARAGHLLQRFMELLLDVDSKAPMQLVNDNDSNGNKDNNQMMNNNDDDHSCFAWINRADSVVAQMYQLLGVDVLFEVL